MTQAEVIRPLIISYLFSIKNYVEDDPVCIKIYVDDNFRINSKLGCLVNE